MGKKNRNNKAKKKPKFNSTNLPFVSICTPTYNRRPFIQSMIECFLHQTYPKDKMEWNIIDDGIDKVGEYFNDIPQVNYKALDEKITLGKKRNMLHKMCKGDIILYMDDDDYYPPERVEHAVTSLLKNKSYEIAGSSTLHIYFNHSKEIYKFGPYGKNHSTAATFAFWKSYIEKSDFDDEACLAEEKKFLKNYETPLLQLDSKKCILVFSHDHNTFDKRDLLVNYEQNQFINKTDLCVSDFIKDEKLSNFYTNEVNNILKDYDLGSLKYKQDVIKQKEKIKKEREERNKRERKLYSNENGKQRELEYYEIVDIVINLQNEINKLRSENVKLNNIISKLSRNNEEKT